MAFALNNPLYSRARFKGHYNAFFSRLKAHNRCLANARSKGKSISKGCANNKSQALAHRKKAREIYLNLKAHRQAKNKWTRADEKWFALMLAHMSLGKSGGKEVVEVVPGVTTTASAARLRVLSTPQTGQFLSSSHAQQLDSAPIATEVEPMDEFEYEDPFDGTEELTFDEDPGFDLSFDNPLVVGGTAVGVGALAYLLFFRR